MCFGRLKKSIVNTKPYILCLELVACRKSKYKTRQNVLRITPNYTHTNSLGTNPCVLCLGLPTRIRPYVPLRNRKHKSLRFVPRTPQENTPVRPPSEITSTNPCVLCLRLPTRIRPYVPLRNRKYKYASYVPETEHFTAPRDKYASYVPEIEHFAAPRDKYARYAPEIEHFAAPRDKYASYVPEIEQFAAPRDKYASYVPEGLENRGKLP